MTPRLTRMTKLRRSTQYIRRVLSHYHIRASRRRQVQDLRRCHQHTRRPAHLQLRRPWLHRRQSRPRRPPLAQTRRHLHIWTWRPFRHLSCSSCWHLSCSRSRPRMTHCGPILPPSKRRRQLLPERLTDLDSDRRPKPHLHQQTPHRQQANQPHHLTEPHALFPHLDHRSNPLARLTVTPPSQQPHAIHYHIRPPSSASMPATYHPSPSKPICNESSSIAR